MPSVVEVRCVDEITGDNLRDMALRGLALIENCGLVYPITCKLFGSAGEQLASWTLSESDDGATECVHDTLEERWTRSAGGVTLLLTDAGGVRCEVCLIVGPREALQ